MSILLSRADALSQEPTRDFGQRLLGCARFAQACILAPVLLMAACQAEREDLILPEYHFVELLRIGSIDDPATALSLASGLAVAEDGRVAIDQRLENNILIYSPNGERLEQIGRDGDGPGEFRRTSLFGWHDDTLWVADSRLRRVTYFPPDRTSPLTMGPTKGMLESEYSFFPRPSTDGRGMMTDSRYPAGQPSRLEVWSLDTSWTPVAHIASIVDLIDELIIAPSDDQVWRARQPYADNPLWTFSPNNMHVTIVERRLNAQTGSDGHFTVTRIGIDGDTLFQTLQALQLLPLDAATQDAIVEEIAGWSALERMAISAAELRDAIRDSIYFPPYHPPVTTVVVDMNGFTWLRGPDASNGTVRWLVLNPMGEPVRSVQTPAKLGIWDGQYLSVMAPHVGGAWGVVHDELGVPYLVNYEERPSSR